MPFLESDRALVVLLLSGWSRVIAHQISFPGGRSLVDFPLVFRFVKGDHFLP